MGLVVYCYYILIRVLACEMGEDWRYLSAVDPLL